MKPTQVYLGTWYLASEYDMLPNLAFLLGMCANLVIWEPWCIIISIISFFDAINHQGTRYSLVCLKHISV